MSGTWHRRFLRSNSSVADLVTKWNRKFAAKLHETENPDSLWWARPVFPLHDLTSPESGLLLDTPTLSLTVFCSLWWHGQGVMITEGTGICQQCESSEWHWRSDRPPISIMTKVSDKKLCSRRQTYARFHCTWQNILMSNWAIVSDNLYQNGCDYTSIHEICFRYMKYIFRVIRGRWARKSHSFFSLTSQFFFTDEMRFYHPPLLWRPLR